MSSASSSSSSSSSSSRRGFRSATTIAVPSWHRHRRRHWRFGAWPSWHRRWLLALCRAARAVYVQAVQILFPGKPGPSIITKPQAESFNGSPPASSLLYTHTYVRAHRILLVTSSPLNRLYLASFETTGPELDLLPRLSRVLSRFCI